jgi:hypothetical protein
MMSCADDGLINYTLTTAFATSPWIYDGTNLEFKNGQICSYDAKLQKMYTAAYVSTYATATGLTDDQLSITIKANTTPYA